MLYGRAAEEEQLRRLLTEAGAGASAALVLTGEAGIGKTALLDHLASGAGRVLRTTGIESENELPFAALHQLLRPALDHLDLLPGPQAEALRAAFGMTAATGRDRFLIGLAVLTLLSEHAGEQALLCLVDDAQWVDQASLDALTFAARRLDAEGVVMLFALREPRPLGLPELRLGRLDEAATAALLAARTGGELPAYVRERVTAEAQGNPLALVELSRAMTAEQRAGLLGPLPAAPGGLSAAGRVQAAFGAQLGLLPPLTRRALLVAAADDTGDPAVVLAAAGAAAPDLEPAEKAGLIHLTGSTLAFRHPLVRAAAYQGATFAERIAAHDALVAVLHGDEHADRRAWHRASAATGPDERAAAELERAAERATGRQGMASASAAYERAAQLSADPAARQRRLVTAAQVAADAGLFHRVAALLEHGDGTGSPEAARVRAALELNAGSAAEAVRVLLGADFGEPAIAVEAVHAALSAGDPGLAARVCERALAAPPGPHGTLTGVALLLTGRATTPRWEDAARDAGALFSERFLAARAAYAVDDHRLAGELAALLLDHCRSHGLLGWQATCLHLLAESRLALGALDLAGQSAAEGLRHAEYAGLDHRACHLRATLATVAALEGDETRCRELAGDALAHATAHDIGSAAAHARHALALLHLGAGDPAPALAHLDRVPPGPPMLTAFLLPGLVEAAARTGTPRPDAAAGYERWARRTGSPAALALAARCRALTSTGEQAEDHFGAALGHHEPGLERSRTHLLYGEWLRRRRRRTDARRHLRAALEGFDRAGAAPWAARARAELRGTGEVIDETAATGSPLGRLTPQEREVVRLAAAGVSNREIAAQLFLSPRTVGHHLYRAFPKLGVTSRRQLADALGR
ncbi:AAA family ATPase [Nonomuraea ceibae]|uniref:AAA family ATPase n=1 Tax=Nonomuraea ceibae TaxID=1935170 RepID=UPI001C607EFD|nr:LuxR family transcriptional regulator [Nonomuraea ceibae]